MDSATGQTPRKCPVMKGSDTPMEKSVLLHDGAATLIPCLLAFLGLIKLAALSQRGCRDRPRPRTWSRAGQPIHMQALVAGLAQGQETAVLSTAERLNLTGRKEEGKSEA